MIFVFSVAIVAEPSWRRTASESQAVFETNAVIDPVVVMAGVIEAITFQLPMADEAGLGAMSRGLA